MRKKALKIKTVKSKGSPIPDYSDFLKKSGFKVHRLKNKTTYVFAKGEIAYRIVNEVGKPLTIIADVQFRIKKPA
jgi:hypothetical protein